MSACVTGVPIAQSNCLLRRAMCRLVWPERGGELLLTWVQRGPVGPLISNRGRLFDAVAAQVTGRSVVSYDEQAAIDLERLADGGVKKLFNWRYSE
jgi:hydrogenase maturation factor HypF (carbamoyltransferase family)